MNTRHLMAALLATLLSVPALAEHALVGEKSDIRFISVKNAAVAEVHRFRSLSGGIEDGAVSVTIPLVDVETMIPIRNERMQKMLFETELYPKATLTAVVDMGKLKALKSGDYTTMEVEFTLDLHGSSKTYSSEVNVARLGDELHVSTEQPLVVSAADFDLTAGIESLREIAGLNNIATQVPVTAQLVFAL
ncbi:MAG: YceI family protein [Halieaceae bacterium]|jgi:hypothetical protein|nr:YceI family protein [Halieaceae bacterium]